jgi:hypothetical protein
MKKLSLLIIFVIFTSLGVNAAEWKEGTPAPSLQATVKTIPQIRLEALHNKELANVVAEDQKHQLNNNPSRDIHKRLFPDFTAARYEDSGQVPPDAMGVVGPAQFILAANGRIRSFDKKTGKADHAIDISMDLFYSPVTKKIFITDSRIRYDRFSERWFLVANAALNNPVRIVIAMSDAPIITSKTKWSFFYVEPRIEDKADYPTIGIDKYALYIGVNIMKKEDAMYKCSDAIVIPKAPLLEGTAKAVVFQEVANSDPKNFEGLMTPQGVDNFDSDASVGYFIGLDGREKRLMMRHIKNPGDHPLISDNIPIDIPYSAWPLDVPQKDSIDSGKFFLQGFDKRLVSSHIRDKMLYTGCNVGVDNKGNSETNEATRDGCLWWEIDLHDDSHPKIAQTGVLYQSSSENDKEERYFWMPGIMTNGLHTLVIGCSTAGDREYADAAFAFRYNDDAPGTLRKPVIYTHSDETYKLGFPPFKILRWGEYSSVSVDPQDNMTFWSIAEFALNANSWGLQAVRIPSPPPASIVAVTPSIIKGNQENTPLVIDGKRVDGSAFYDPGEGYANRLKVEIEDMKVLQQKWISPTQIEVFVSTASGVNHGAKTIKITNPDGQSIEAKELLQLKSADNVQR